MNAPKHTAGPWRLVIDDTGGPQSGWPLVIVAADDEDKSVVRPGGQWPYEWDASMSQREAVANARLIAAAPDLLEALVLILPLAKGYQPEGQTDTARRTCNSWVEAAEQAIAKATGATQ